MDAEQKLSEFRRRRKQRDTIEKVKEYVASPFQFLKEKMTENPSKNTLISVDEIEDDVSSNSSLLGSSGDDVGSSCEDIMTDTVEDDKRSLLGLSGLIKYLAYFTLWIIPYILLIKLGFGAVYFCISALFFIYFNTRTRPKLKNEPSAYSVFNQGCAPLDGAISSEQLEKQLRSGMIGS